MAAMMLNCPSMGEFQPDDEPASVASRWERWLDRFENYLVAMQIVLPSRKKAMLLHFAGERVYDIYRGLPAPAAPAEGQAPPDVYVTAKTQLTGYFSPRKNIEFERYVFRQAKQEPSETVDQFNNRLRRLAVHCEFTDQNQEIKSQIIMNGSSARLRRRALRDPGLDLEGLLTLGRTMEVADTQAAGIEGSDTHKPEVNQLSSARGKFTRNQPSKNTQYQSKKPDFKPQAKSNNNCFNCGGQYPHTRGPESCPAYGTECGACHKFNHFARVCRSSSRGQDDRKPKSMPWWQKRRGKGPADQQQDQRSKQKSTAALRQESSDDDDGFVFTVGLGHVADTDADDTRPQVSVIIGNSKTSMLLDTGSSVNLVDQRQFDILSANNKLSLTKGGTKIYAYGSETPINIMGKFETTVETKNKITPATFYVVEGAGGSLLGYQTSTDLGLVRIPEINMLPAKPDKPEPVEQAEVLSNDRSSGSEPTHILKDFPEVFTGLGRLKNYLFDVHVDPNVVPIAQSYRRVPFHIRSKVEEELDKLQQAGIIEDATGPTPWVSPIVVVPKKDPSQVRICVDMRGPNTAVIRERHPTPTIEEIIHDLNGATVFSRLDLKQGYHQLELSPESRGLTTFATHKGLKRYVRLPFGLSSAAETFQHVVQQVLQGIPGVRNISDDIIVFGKDQQSHDRALRATLARLQDAGLTLNRPKCEFNKPQLCYFGVILSANGLSPDPAKVDAVKNADQPTSVSEVRSFLGLTNYVSRFIPNYASIVEPLRLLTRQNVPWDWTDACQAALDSLKAHLSADTVMAYYDPNQEVDIITDASPVGLGAVLMQYQAKAPQTTRRVISYASKTLTDTERRYSQTEREALAIKWACQKFHIYVYGTPFTVTTDHRPLVPMFNKTRANLPTRIERWQLQLQPYDVTVRYRPGADNPADYLSRHPVSSPGHQSALRDDVYVNFIAHNAVPKSMSFEQVAEAADEDPEMVALTDAITTGKWRKDNEKLKPYYRLRGEFSVVDGTNVVLRGTRLVLPKALRSQALDIAHETHQGLVKTKRLLRQKVWFPNIDAEAEALIKTCLPCQAAGPPERREPLKMTEMPSAPWSQLSADFHGPLPTGEYILIVIDDYSRFPEFAITTSTSAQATIPKLERIFATHGIPDVLKTDNGPPFQSKEFKDFATRMGFKHRKVTPYWPNANGEVENFMKTLGQFIRKTSVENKNWKKEINQFMMNYRATPHSTTMVPPAELLFKRNIKTKLPQVPNARDKDDAEVHMRDTNQKAKMKGYADARRHTKQSTLQVGDNVLVKQVKARPGQLQTPFGREPHIVVALKGSMVILKSPTGKRFARNRAHVKKIPDGVGHVENNADQDEDFDDLIPDHQRRPLQDPPDRDEPLRRNPPRLHRRPERFRDYV